MKITIPAVISAAAAFLVAACVMFEDRLARMTTPEIAAAAIAASCVGGREFIAAATTSLDEATATLLNKGVETACALRTKRKPISATIYDAPLDQFCAESEPLKPDEVDEATRETFNATLLQYCEVGS